MTKTNLLLTIGFIVIGSFLVFFADAALYLTVLSLLQELIPQQVNYTQSSFVLSLTFVIAFIIRSIIAFLISIVIIKFHLLSVGNLIVVDDSVISLSGIRFGKFFYLSYLICGVSNANLAILPLLASNFINVNTVLTTIIYFVFGVSGLMLSPWLFIVEVMRISLSTWLIQRRIIKSSKKILQKDR